jgi:dihydrofolate reductase
MIVSMVVATGPNGEIGLNNKLLWHIKEDLQNFKKITTGKMVVMGRKTFESIGKALPLRTNIVITRDQTFNPEGVIVVHDPMMVFDLALEMEEEKLAAKEGEASTTDFELMIIGGAEMYQFFLPYAQKIYLSEVPYQGDADTFFPKMNPSDWEVTESASFTDFNFKILSRV